MLKSLNTHTDWLSRLLQIITVTGRVETRCAYGSPWRITYETSPHGEIPYHVVLRGSAVLERSDGGEPLTVNAGDIVWLSHGSAHMLHDGSGRRPKPARERQGQNFIISENSGTGDRMDMLCGRFIVAAPHDRLMTDYLPPTLVVSANSEEVGQEDETASQLAHLAQLLRIESSADRLGALAMLNALSEALFALGLRLASLSPVTQTGLLALAGQPRLAPAVTAIFSAPHQQWTIPELAKLCNMSRATFARQIQDCLGHSAHDLLLDVRMSFAANALKRPSVSTESVAADVGYQSVAAFRRAFAQRMGMTPGEWRRLARADTTVQPE
jgi:AraC family transcriptional activator of mtrCDE